MTPAQRLFQTLERHLSITRELTQRDFYAALRRSDTSVEDTRARVPSNARCARCGKRVRARSVQLHGALYGPTCASYLMKGDADV